MKKKSDNKKTVPIFYIEENGLIKVSYGGKVLLLLLTGVLSLWFLVLVLVNYDIIKKEGSQGEAIFYLAIISLSLLIITVFEKFFISTYFINLSRQISVLTFFVTIFMFIRILPKSKFDGMKIYENPAEIGYIFIIFYFISFYILHNFSNR